MLYLLNLTKTRKVKKFWRLECIEQGEPIDFIWIVLTPKLYVRYSEAKLKIPKCLAGQSRTSLQLESFQQAKDKLKKERLCNLIFIGGSHRMEDARWDSLLAFQIVASRSLLSDTIVERIVIQQSCWKSRMSWPVHLKKSSNKELKKTLSITSKGPV